MRTYRSDAVVIGGGLAGICAALELLEAGRSVTLIDRDAEENFGGLAKESFGGIFVVGSREQKKNGIEDSPARAFADWCAFAEFGAEDHWPRRWAEAYTERCHDEVYAWLKRHGIGFIPVPHWIERGSGSGGNSVPRFHIVWGTGQELAARLIGHLRGHRNAAKLALRFGHRVEGLSTRAGQVDGCHGALEDGGEPFEAFGEALLVAAGGINGGDLSRARRHWHADWRSPPPTLLNGSHKFADGLLHDAVALRGGRLTHLDRMWDYAAGVRHWQPRKPGHGLSVVPPRSALWVDWQGRRFMPPLLTGFDTRDLVTRVCATERQYSWQILNRRIALKELAVSGAEFNPSIRERRRLAFLRDLLLGNRWLVDTLLAKCEDVVAAGSLPALVEKMNALQGDRAVELELLGEAVGRWDAEVRRGDAAEDEQLRRIDLLRRWKGDRLRTCRRAPILDHGALPLIAIREHIISRKSLGGIQTDLDSRVLGPGGEPLARLWAAGEAAGFGGGGMHGLRALEGGFLGGCILSGRLAGQSMGRSL